MNLRTRQVDLPTGVTVPYVERGSPGGPHLLLLHAVGDSWHSFERVLPHLPETLHVVVPSQRGHGGATAPTSGYATEDFAADVVALMDVLDLPSAVLAGGSSGGLVARRVAIEHPDRVRGLALLGSPAALTGNPTVEAWWEGTVRTLTDPVPEEFVDDVLDACVALPVPDDFLATMRRESLRVPAHVWAGTFRGLLDDDTFDRLGGIGCPTRVVWGGADALLPRRDQDRLVAAIPGATLTVYAEAGHVLYWEEPRRTARDLADLVAVAGRPGRG
ncbi:alpha/beta hydrolase [Nocardioides guangzhouensis]|uniref:Alpha/beta hydrolase n=1 Tax=Nocardioides guangzhouensis TaxID=2497878 RepID=A0A4Q4ZG96_9ACTN|nr:alpha/beta hydrolase [Nocardioides guangzhouensis]RYP86461.1 alpha/beta hydrolase [Nocardioides guangzhouensis]